MTQRFGRGRRSEFQRKNGVSFLVFSLSIYYIFWRGEMVMSWGGNSSLISLCVCSIQRSAILEHRLFFCTSHSPIFVSCFSHFPLSWPLFRLLASPAIHSPYQSPSSAPPLYLSQRPSAHSLSLPLPRPHPHPPTPPSSPSHAPILALLPQILPPTRASDVLPPRRTWWTCAEDESHYHRWKSIILRG